MAQARMIDAEPLVTYTLFPDVWPKTKTERADVPWSDLVTRIVNAPTYIDKAHCPLISMAEYGDTLSVKGYLRHGENVRRIFGVELDYDGELMPLDLAAQRLRNANIRAVLYTSPSHTPAKPRWRAILPLSEPTFPEKRAEYVGRANRVLGGVASRESFTLSQSFYIGRVRGAEYETDSTDGRCIDMAADILPQYHSSGAATGNDQPRDSTTDEQLREAFNKGEDRYQAMLKLSSRWAARGMSRDDIEASLFALFGTGPSTNGDGIDLRERVPGIAESAARKFGETRKPFSEQHRESVKTAKANAQQDITERVRALKPPTLAEIKTTEAPPRPWFFESVIPAGAFLFVGRSKIGKSWLLMQLILCAAKCAKFLDWHALGQFGCLYIASEDDAARIKSRVRAFGVEDFPANVEVMTRAEFNAYAQEFAPYMTLAEFLRLYLIQRPRLKIVVLDTESTIRMAWNNETKKVSTEKSITRKDYAEISEMDSIAIELGIFLALVNHTSKRRAAKWFDIHETINRTNTAMAGASGSMVLADPPDADPNDNANKVRVLGIRGRDIRDEYLIAIEQREGSPMFHSIGPYTAHMQTQAEQEILTALEELDAEEATPNQWHTASDIAQAVGKQQWAVKKAITRMMAKGPVTWKGRKVETRKKLGIRFLPEFKA